MNVNENEIDGEEGRRGMGGENTHSKYHPLRCLGQVQNMKERIEFSDPFRSDKDFYIT